MEFGQVPGGRPSDYTPEIYALIDPRTGEVRYIGKANNSAKRLASHCRDAKRRVTPVYVWIKELAEIGLKPDMKIVAVVTDGNWQKAERQAIAEHSKNGRLLNLAKGGNEPFCPPEVRAKNGANVAKSRNKRLWALYRSLGADLKAGYVSEHTKEKMRARPDVFGRFAAYL